MTTFRELGNLENMLKMPVNGVPWSLLKKLPQAPKCLECQRTQVPQVHDCLECLQWLECSSVLSTRMLECLQNAYEMPTKCPDGTKFWIYLYFSE